jgi:hypothetical protein
MFIRHRKQTYRYLRPVTEIDLIFYVNDFRTSQGKYLWECTANYGDILNFLCVDDVRTSLETHLWSSTACYRDSINFLYVDGVCISQETHIRVSTDCYGDNSTSLYVGNVRTSQETRLWAPTTCFEDRFAFFNEWHTALICVELTIYVNVIYVSLHMLQTASVV